MQKEELNELLTKAKELLREEMTPIAYSTWIRELDIESADNNNIVLVAIDPFQKESLSQRLQADWNHFFDDVLLEQKKLPPDILIRNIIISLIEIIYSLYEKSV